MTDAGNNFALKIVTEPQEIAIWIPLTAYSL